MIEGNGESPLSIVSNGADYILNFCRGSPAFYGSCIVRGTHSFRNVFIFRLVYVPKPTSILVHSRSKKNRPPCFTCLLSDYIFDNKL
jgi:hypothetical protein